MQKWVNKFHPQYSIIESDSAMSESSFISSQLSGSNAFISEFQVNNCPSSNHKKKLKKLNSETAQQN